MKHRRRFAPGTRSPRCQVCAHEQSTRIDYLLASGAVRRAVARKFGLDHDAVLRHYHLHISDDYKRKVKIGPFRSEEELRRLVAENSTSVVENLLSIYSGLASRWLACFEVGADDKLVALTKSMHTNLELRAKISKEIAPPPGNTIITNVFNLPPVIELQAELLKVLARHPEARRDVIRTLRDLERKQPPLLEVAPNAERAA